jgi:hypothetical protein
MGGRLCVGMQAGVYRGHRAELRLCAHNAKSKVMVSGDERCLRLWRPFSGKELGGCVSQSMYTWCTSYTPLPHPVQPQGLVYAVGAERSDRETKRVRRQRVVGVSNSRLVAKPKPAPELVL